ncbi:MAG: Cys-tRNA(Pro) deacylase [Cyanobacteria bacterium]|nr:Cys-tRNA(Pro) deacylase [Cyanobacteriota bacterium]
MKTNAARLLDRLKLPYDILTYEVDPNDLAAERVAEKLNLPPAQVFKTLVAQGHHHGVCLAVIPADSRLDLKALAKLSGDRKAETVPLKEVQNLTGYIRGGVTALACKKPYPVYLDQSASSFEQIAVSAGKRGYMLLLTPADYCQATSALCGDLTLV